MQIGLILVVVALAVSLWHGFVGPKQTTTTQNSTSTVQQISQKSNQTISQSKPKTATPNNNTTQQNPTSGGILVDTDIKSGPQENQIITDTNKVTFEFGATVLPKKTGELITFETKVVGLETSWQSTDQKIRTVEFPAGPKQYTFLVRAKAQVITDSTPASRTFTVNISPYFAKVKFGPVTLPTNLSPSLLTLNTFLSQNGTVDITGWQIKGKNGQAIIPQGIETYNPLTTTLISKNIIVKSNDTIYVSTEANPLGGNNWNFRPNKCFGYLLSSHKFPIQVYKNCPFVNTATLPSSLQTCCLNLISSLGSCEEPTYQKKVDYAVLKDDGCLSYLAATFNYNGCYANHFQDSDFNLTQWHIYLNRIDREVMDQKLDTIYLLDKSGLLVDKYSYGTACCGQ